MNAVTTRTKENKPAKEKAGQAPQRLENRRTVQPDTDILTTKEGIEFRMDIPGVAEKDIEIQLEKNILTVRAQRQLPSTENYKPWVAEAAYHDYECGFRLGFQADPEKIIARYKYGVLTVLVPRHENDQPKRIAVKSE